jgi:NAD(P)H-dependent FMN reductase
MPKIVSISGTSRPDNYTARALAVVNDTLRESGAALDVFDAREMELGFPGHAPTADATAMQSAVKAAAAVVLATPEYHGSFCAMTKLIIENLGFPSALSGKPIALVGVAAGRIGAIKSLEQLKGVCSHVGAIVVPGSVSIAGVQGAFDDDGRCTDPDAEKALRGAAGGLLEFLKEYVCPKHALEAMVRGEGKPWSANV